MFEYITHVFEHCYSADLATANNVRDIVYNTDLITSVVQSIVHSPVGKLIQLIYICLFVLLLLANITLL